MTYKAFRRIEGALCSAVVSIPNWMTIYPLDQFTRPRQPAFVYEDLNQASWDFGPDYEIWEVDADNVRPYPYSSAADWDSAENMADLWSMPFGPVAPDRFGTVAEEHWYIADAVKPVKRVR